MESTSQISKLSKSKKRRRSRLRAAKNNTGAWRCHICGKELNKNTATVDHLIPLSMNGPNGQNNTKLACDTCNHIRSNEPIYFFKMKFFLLQNECVATQYFEQFKDHNKTRKKFIKHLKSYKKYCKSI